MPLEATECQCGCGTLVTSGKRYFGMHGKRMGNRVQKSNPNFGFTVSRRRKELFKLGLLKSPTEGKHHSERTKRLISQIRKHNLATGKETHPRGNLGKRLTLEQKRRLGDIIHNEYVSGKRLSPKGRKWPEESKQMASETHKRKWLDEAFAKRMIECQSRRPSRPELRIQALLDANFPSEWRYVGNGAFWIEGKNPDFINCNGKKAIIEYDSAHWHKDSVRDENRNGIYLKYGYSVICLNEKDLTDENLLVERISKEVYARGIGS